MSATVPAAPEVVSTVYDNCDLTHCSMISTALLVTFWYSLSYFAVGSKHAPGSDMAVLAGMLVHHPVIFWQNL